MPPPPQSTPTGARLFPKNPAPVDVLWGWGGSSVSYAQVLRGGVLCLLYPRPTHKRSCKYFQYLQLLAIITATLQKIQINTQIICENTTPVGKKLERTLTILANFQKSSATFEKISRKSLHCFRIYLQYTNTILEYTQNIPKIS